MGAIACATDIQMLQRNALLFKSNVYINNVISVVTFVLSICVIKKLYKKSFFPDSTQVLIWLALGIVNMHQIIYAVIQNWSLYRALMYWDQPCKIMFNEYECFPWYTANIFSRLLILFTDCALTTDRLITAVRPEWKTSYFRGIIQFIIALLFAIGYCLHITRDGPNDNPLGNCYQRLGRNIDELKDQIAIYLYIILTCLALNVISGALIWRALHKKQFIVSDQYSKQVSFDSALVIFLILIFHIVCLGFYSISIHTLIDNAASINPVILGNIVLWFYTYPWASVSLPVGICISTRFITRRRRQKINGMTKKNQDENVNTYFEKLQTGWHEEFENRSVAKEIAPVG